MLFEYLNIVTLVMYFCAFLYALALLRRGEDLNDKALTLGIAAIVFLHSISIYHLVIVGTGINLSIGLVSSLMMSIINIIVLISSLRKPLHNIFVLLLPLSIIAVFIAEFSSNITIIHPIEPEITAHILLSIVAYSLITITALQALLVNWQNNSLKQGKISRFIKHLPPLQTMESLMFEILFVGFVLLSIALLLGIFSIEDMFAQHLAHKTVLSIFAWLIFTVLLLGRNRWGWRGNQAVRWVLSGFCCLMLAYFGSKLVLEVILV